MEEVSIIKPTTNKEAYIWVKVQFDVDDVIRLTKTVMIMKKKASVELDFMYKGLEKFCTICGSLKHKFKMCKESSQLQQRNMS